MPDLTSLPFLQINTGVTGPKGHDVFTPRMKSEALAKFTERPKYLSKLCETLSMKSSQQLTKLCGFKIRKGY